MKNTMPRLRNLILSLLLFKAQSYCPPGGMMGCLEGCRLVSLSPKASELFASCSATCFQYCEAPTSRRRLQEGPIQGQCLSQQVVLNSEELDGVKSRLDVLETQECGCDTTGVGATWPTIKVIKQPGAKLITDLRKMCLAQDPPMDLVSVKSAEHVIWLREQLLAAGVDVKLGRGTPLGFDYKLANEYFDLTDPKRSVQSIFDELRNKHQWTNGDHHIDQTAAGQHYAGIGWQEDGLGVEDWDDENHVNEAIICEAKQLAYNEVKVMHNADYNYGAQSLDAAREVCTDNGEGWDLVSIRDEGHVMWLHGKLVEAEVPITLGKGVPLGYDYGLSNSYDDLVQKSRSVQGIFNSLRDNYKWTGGDHHTDQTGEKQQYAGIGWYSSGVTDYGIEDWSPTGHNNSAVICEKN